MVFQTKKYKWNYSHPVDAETVGKTLEEIEDSYGEVTPALLLDASKADDSPTHNLFTWDDAVAAEKYRLSEAGRVIRDLHIEYVSESHEPTDKQIAIEGREPIKYVGRAYVNVIPVEDNSLSTAGRFVNIGTAMSDSEMRKNVLLNAQRELRIFTQKYKKYEELSAVIESIERYLERTK